MTNKGNYTSEKIAIAESLISMCNQYRYKFLLLAAEGGEDGVEVF